MTIETVQWKQNMKDRVNRLYDDLAWLWPLWEDVEEYKKESKLFAELIKKYSNDTPRTLLDIGCGSGKFTFHLKRHFKITGIDVSESMLANAKNLNPDCEFVATDMRDFNLQRQFDSVFVNDSITYITTRKELLATFRNAYRHLKAGGVMITFPDDTKETFVQNKTEISLARARSKPENLEVTFIENYYDPNPDDEAYEATFVFLIRENGKLKIEHDFHTCGLFKLNTWRRSLKNTGFEVYEEGWPDAIKECPIFVCIKTGDTA
jgi:ubiquinone/menaquinone biosynthesis C-methylase UbiE